MIYYENGRVGLTVCNGSSVIVHHPFLAAALAAVLRTLAGLDLPKDPLEILPFLVLISPLPIVIIVYSLQLQFIVLRIISRKLQ
jgi:hypothetical protein